MPARWVSRVLQLHISHLLSSFKVCPLQRLEEAKFQAAQKGQPTRPQARQEPEAYPLGYVEDSCEPRTKLGAFFSSRLRLDGHVDIRRMSTPASGTSYQSSNPKVIRVLPHGLVQIVGNGKTTVTVTNRSKQASLDVTVDVNEEPNEPPVADAGLNQSVKAGTKVKLSGLKSRDAEGEALYYAWSQVRGSKIALLDVDNAEPSFLAPTVSEKRTYRFKLRVTDEKGADSVPAFVDVTVGPVEGKRYRESFLNSRLLKKVIQQGRREWGD